MNSLSSRVASTILLALGTFLVMLTLLDGPSHELSWKNVSVSVSNRIGEEPSEIH